jgi:hypothetical protein
VPGDSDTEHFYARNQGGDAARLTVEYDLPPNALVDDTDVEVTASIDGGTPVPLSPGVDWLPVGQTDLADGGVADVAVSATFRPTSTNQSMNDSFQLAFRVTLTEAAGSTPGTDETGSPTATPTVTPAVTPTAGGGPGGDTGGGPLGTVGPAPTPKPGAGTPGAGTPDGDRGASGPHLGGLLPGTGAPEVGWLVGLGVLCLGGGIAIVALSARRRRDAESQ